MRSSLLELVIAELHPTRLIRRLGAASPWRVGAAVCVVGLIGGSLG